jgi:sulfide:quinone oxidoreductase
MYGRTPLDAMRLPYANFVKPGVRLRRETIVAIDPTARRVMTDAGIHDANT